MKKTKTGASQIGEENGKKWKESLWEHTVVSGDLFGAGDWRFDKKSFDSDSGFLSKRQSPAPNKSPKITGF